MLLKQIEVEFCIFCILSDLLMHIRPHQVEYRQLQRTISNLLVIITNLKRSRQIEEFVELFNLLNAQQELSFGNFYFLK